MMLNTGKNIKLNNAGKIKDELNISAIEDALYFPKFFEVETVNACNARCRMCTIKDWKKRELYLMSDDTWANFLRGIKSYSQRINRVNLSRDGEPLLDNKLGQKIEDLKKASIRFVTLATNVSLLTRKKAQGLLDSGLDDIMFSIDGFSKDTFEKIRKGLKFKEVMDNALNFIKTRDKGKYKTSIRVRMVLQEGNINELGDWTDFWSSKLKTGDRVYAKPMHSWGNQLRTYNELTRHAEGKDYSRQACVSPWSTLVVKVNGDVPLCPVDFKCRFLMGNINKKSVKDIWLTKRFMDIRDQLLSGKRNEVKLCRNCYLWDRGTIIENEDIKTRGRK